MILNLLKPGNALLLILFIGALLLFSKKQNLGKKVIAAAVAFLMMVSVFPVGSWLLNPLEIRFPSPSPLPEKLDGIIVLGGSFAPELIRAHRQLVMKDSGERILSFFSLARRYPEAQLVFAGGLGSLGPEGLGSSLPHKPFFEQMGIDSNRVLLEQKANNTYENAVFTRELVKNPRGKSWVLITSAYHMPRAYGVFRKLDWSVIPYPVDYRTAGTTPIRFSFNLLNGLQLFSLALREWGALTWYFLKGDLDTWFPGPEEV